jgi:two-component system LytT family response regulator
MRILIVEDEQAAAQRLSTMIAKLHPHFKILDILDSIEESVNWFLNGPDPDMMLLDVHLSDGISFEIFNHVEIKCPVIFTTAYDQYAVKAFAIHAVDYLLKPIKIAELARSLDRVKDRMDQNKLKALQNVFPGSNLPKRVLVKIGKTIKVLEYKQAAYFYTKDKITFLHTFDNRRFPIDLSLEKLEDILNPEDFFRINRQFIVNLKAISEMHTYSKSRVKIDLEPGSSLDTIVSTERASKFKKWLVGD